MEAFETSSIWKKTLGKSNELQFPVETEELRTAFLKFRINTSHLVSRISLILPGLTQHDISHLDALWDVASLIVGDDFPINPLEAFILGGAILIHDSALCFEAYSEGQEGIRQTVQWKDAYSELFDEMSKADDEDIKKQADFAALRELHAKQAESLLEKSWVDPDNGEQVYLLENQTLRKHLGKLIGQIAASHHWDIEALPAKLSHQQNAMPNYPREWRIDSVKIACILRCADAAHIDNLRAPDFLHALLKRNGISFSHWQAQNKLSKVDIDQSDPNKETLLFTSTLEFTEDETEAWFIAYDAACLVDKEIKASNALLLGGNPALSFKIKKVNGIDSPENLARFVRVSNWKPCSAQVHVSNLERLIDNLGGRMLYGEDVNFVGIGIRELIQNARDAIVARTFIEGSYNGKIIIKIEEKESAIYLTIEDNGIGMSERVLTGPLLDFGTSFWSSSLVKSEFPGLRSSTFRSIGKFGIGFYSVFMIADQVFVSSKNWDKGLSEINQLEFKCGFTLRPILKKGMVPDFHSSTSTQIKLKLKSEVIPKDLLFGITTNHNGVNFKVPLSNYISALCAGLDVPVYFVNKNSKEINIHQSIKDSDFDKEKWLKDISFSEFQEKNPITEYITKNYNRLKPIIQEGQILGLAAISTKHSGVPGFLNISTVGGLAPHLQSRSNDNFIGFIDYKPKSAKRDFGEYAFSENVLNEWVKDQMEILKNVPLSSFERYCAASAFCHFKYDPRQIAQIPISINNQRQYYTFEQMAELSTTIGIAFLESSFGGQIETNSKTYDFPGYALVLSLFNSSFLSLKFTEDNIPAENNSILGCLYRTYSEKKMKPKLSKLEKVGINSFGFSFNAIIITAEKETIG